MSYHWTAFQEHVHSSMDLVRGTFSHSGTFEGMETELRQRFKRQGLRYLYRFNRETASVHLQLRMEEHLRGEFVQRYVETRTERIAPVRCLRCSTVASKSCSP